MLDEIADEAPSNGIHLRRPRHRNCWWSPRGPWLLGLSMGGSGPFFPSRGPFLSTGGSFLTSRGSFLPCRSPLLPRTRCSARSRVARLAGRGPSLGLSMPRMTRRWTATRRLLDRLAARRGACVAGLLLSLRLKPGVPLRVAVALGPPPFLVGHLWFCKQSKVFQCSGTLYLDVTTSEDNLGSGEAALDRVPGSPRPSPRRRPSGPSRQWESRRARDSGPIQPAPLVGSRACSKR